MASFPDAAASAANLWSPRQIAVEIDGPEGRLHILVSKPFARVGRDRRAEVSLSDGALLPCHLYLHATDEGLYYVGLAADAASGWLLPSDSLELGPFQLRARLADAAPGCPSPADLQAKQNGPSPVPHLRVFSGGRQARSTDLRLRRRLVLLGREPPATRRFNHPDISRVHCAAFWDGRDLWLVDFFSSNGTRLAGRKFDSGKVFRGQEFRLGSVRFVYLGAHVIDEPNVGISALEQPVGIEYHGEEADRHDSDFPSLGTDQSEVSGAIQQQIARLEQERDQFQQLVDERMAAIREELLKEVATLRQESQSAGNMFQRLSSEVATTREDLFALYAEIAPKVAEEGLSATAELSEQIVQLRGELEKHAADFAPLKSTLAAIQPTLTRLESGQWVADLQRQWQVHLQKVIDDVHQRIADIDRQTALDRQAVRDRVALLEGVLTAEIADLRHRFGVLREMADHERGGLPGMAAGLEMLSGRTGGPLTAGSPPSVPPSSGETAAGRQRTQTREDAETAGPPEWVINDQLTERLLEFKSNREQVARRRRLIWTAVAAGLAAIIVSGAGILRIWLHENETMKPSEAASLEQSRLLTR